MLTAHTQNLAAYFQQSGRFYYFLTDLRGYYTYVNPLFQKQFAHITADFYSTIAADTFIAADAEKYRLAISQCLEQPGKIVRTELNMKLQDGSFSLIQWEFSLCGGDKSIEESIQAIGFSVNEITGLISVSEAITERKKAEEQLQKSELFFRSLIAHFPGGILVTDEKGKIRFTSPSITAIPDFDIDHIAGKAAFDFAHPEDAPAIIAAFQDELTDNPAIAQELIEQEIQKQKQLMQATIDGQEKERLEIGKELHDNINQHLTITRLYLEVAREKATGEILEMITLAHKNLAGVINEIRQMSQSLVPPTLGDLGLVESVLDLCDSLQRTHTFNIDFLYRHFTEEQLPDNLKLMFFRIIQEQVNNIIRHASANNIRIRLQSDAEYIILTIDDDGQGFNPASHKKGQGFSNISNRAGLFNGRVEIDSAPGRGCSVTVIVPQETV